VRREILRKVPLFARLSDKEIRLIAKKLRLQRYPGGTIIFDVGDPSGAMYLVKSGAVELRLDASEQFALETLEAGDFFGDVALISDRPRTMSVCVTEDGAELWVLAKTRFASLIAENPVLAARLAVGSDEVVTADAALLELLCGVPFFVDLGDAELSTLAGKMRQETYAAGDLHVAEGTPGEAMYLIAEGAVKVISDAAQETRILATLSRGNVFGELSLLTDKPHAVAARAITDVTLWSLSRADFNVAAALHPVIALNVARVLGERSIEGEAITVTPVRASAPPAVSSGFRMALAGLAVQARVGAADALTWFQHRSRGAQVRIAVVALLLVYLVGISAPATVLSAMAPVGAEVGSQLAMLVATPTPTPPNKPTPTNTPTPTPTATATATATPTATPMPPTATPEPTATPVPPTATPKPVKAASRKPKPTKAPTATPKPAVDFVVAEKRPLTACENRLGTILFVEVLDMNGIPLDGVPVTFNTADDAHPAHSVSGCKGPGKCEFVLICGNIKEGCEGWKVYVDTPFTTEVADGIRNNFRKEDPNGGGGWVWVEERCAETGQMGNVGKHWSWKVVFRKTHP